MLATFRYDMIAAVAIAACCSAVVRAADPPITEIDRLLDSGDCEQAAELMIAADEQLPAGSPAEQSDRFVLTLAKAAQSCRRAEHFELAADLFARAVERLQTAEPSQLQDNQIVLVRIAAASTFLHVGQLEPATDELEQVLDPSSAIDQAQRKLVANMLLAVGSQAFAAKRPRLGGRAYALAIPHVAGDQLATARLGAAWSLATVGDDPQRAARQLAGFVDQFPDHPDAPRAARASAVCLSQCGRDDDAQRVLEDLLERWPRSQAAIDVVQSHQDVSPAQTPTSVAEWFAHWIGDVDADPLDASTIAFGVRVAATHPAAFDAWEGLAMRLAANDEDGQETAKLLDEWDASGETTYAERLAAIFIAPPAEATINVAVREAACRWAGKSSRWSMLALGSEQESVLAENAHRSVVVERLFAESLMQTGRQAEARCWWQHLVDQRHCDDFPTLLRCAETATAAAEVTEATARIEAARQAAGEQRAAVALVDALDAELAIRKLDFDSARSRLEQVVRNQHAPPTLPGRAQWLIGETYFLQQRFSEAIDAYRRVEGIDDSGVWVAASLVQAGKSFEQLGRTRDATVCYGNLLSRFADSPHAQQARKRLAALAPQEQSPHGAMRR